MWWALVSIHINGVKKFFHEGEHVVHAINGIDLSFEKGEFAALAGPSGSGKTTLLNLIGGLDRPDEGTISIGDVTTNERSDD